MARRFFIILILTVFVSCGKQKIIPEEVLTEIIYKMYLTDAVLLTREPSMPHKDSMRIYEPLVEKFGYNFDDLRRTFLKYTAEDGKLQSVLKEVAKKIDAEKNIYKEPARIEKLSENMNIGNDSIYIESKTLSKSNIEVRLSEQGVYDVSASYFFYQNDSTKNPKMIVWLESRTYKDSIVNKQEINLIKDTVFNDYSIRVDFNNQDFNILKIFWLDFDNEPEISKPKTQPSSSKTSVNKRITNSKKKTDIKPKKENPIKQHLIIKNKSVKYNFEESDTTKLKEIDDFVGPPSLFEFFNIEDSIANIIDTVGRIFIIRKVDSIKSPEPVKLEAIEPKRQEKQIIKEQIN
jgi:hypothetical protein